MLSVAVSVQEGLEEISKLSLVFSSMGLLSPDVFFCICDGTCHSDNPVTSPSSGLPGYLITHYERQFVIFF